MLQKKRLYQLITEYVEEYSLLKDFSKNTLQNKRELFLRFIKFLGDRPLTLDNVQLYVKDMKDRNVSANSIKTEIANVKAFIHWLIKKKKIQMEDWTGEVETPRVHHAPEMLPDIYQAEKCIELGTEPGRHDHSGHRERKALMLFAMKFTIRTGVRGTELRHIRGKDLYISDNDPESSKVYLIAAKGGTPQWQPCHESLKWLIHQ